MVFAPQLRHISIPLDSLPVATAVADVNGTILDANDRFRRLFGIDRAVNAPPTLADLVADAHRPAVQQAIDDLNASDRDGFAATRPARPHRLRATRAKTPNLWLAIELTRLEPESG